MYEFIFQTVCLVLGEKFTTWKATGLKMLRDLVKFIKSLTDKIEEINEKGAKAISPKILKKLKVNLENEYLGEAKLAKDAIARPLGLWCRAIYDFATLKKLVEPLEVQAKEM